MSGAKPVLKTSEHYFFRLSDERAVAFLRETHSTPERAPRIALSCLGFGDDVTDLAPMRESLTGFLTGWLGGPRDWFATGKCVMGVHAPFVIDAGLRDEWLDAMGRAILDTISDADVAAMLNASFFRVASAMTRD